MASRAVTRFAALPLLACLPGCPNSSAITGGDAGHRDASTRSDANDSSRDAGVDTGTSDDASIPDGPLPTGPFCTFPGAVQYTAFGTTIVPGGAGNTEDVLNFLHLPTGFCAHYYANVRNARQIKFAPNGDLFVASPTQATTAAGLYGENAIVILPDRHDGYAGTPAKYLTGLPATQGMLFANGSFYYQNGTGILRVPYVDGDQHPSGAAVLLADITYYNSTLHWPKPMDIADDGTIYVGNGGDQGEPCVDPHGFNGGVVKLAGSTGDAGIVQVTKGFRNAIAIRCQHGHNQCFALELSEDYTASFGGREKMGLIQQGGDWGFPCCATQNLLYGDLTGSEKPPNGNADCANVYAEPVGFYIGDTPFGFDFEPGLWPAPYTNSAFIVLHGEAGSWTGARLVSVAIDPSTHLPVASSDTSGSDTGGMTDFGTGWDDNTTSHGRPGSAQFAADGRLFIANDQNGDIIWIAPQGLMPASHGGSGLD